MGLLDNLKKRNARLSNVMEEIKATRGKNMTPPKPTVKKPEPKKNEDS